MSEILIVRDDGVIRIEGAVPIARSFTETVEHLYQLLDIRPRNEEQPPQDRDKPGDQT